VRIALEFLQKSPHASESSIQDLLRDSEQVLEQRIGDPVLDDRTLPARHDNTVRSQPGQLLRHNRLFDGKLTLQVLHAHRTLRHQYFEQPDADRVCECSEEFRFEGLQLS